MIKEPFLPRARLEPAARRLREDVSLMGFGYALILEFSDQFAKVLAES